MSDILKRSDVKSLIDVAVGIILFMSTVYFASNVWLLVLLALLLVRDSKVFWPPEMMLIVLMVVAAYLNIFLNLNTLNISYQMSSLGILLVLAMAVLAPRMSERSLKIFVVLSCLEVLIGVFEYQTGQVALFRGQLEATGQHMSMNSILLYDLRVFGLSSNSSILAEKVFLCLIISISRPSLFNYRWLILIIIALGLFVSFNRTAILSSIVFIAMVAMRGRFRLYPVLIGSSVLAGLVFVVRANLDTLLFQFTRGSFGELSHSELSRLYFWEKGWEMLKVNPLLGNGSLKFYVEDPATGLLQHAHNSFVMLFATHGVLISLLLLTYVIIRTLSTDRCAIIAILIFSMAQYFVFWNLSVPDMIFFWFLGVNAHRSYQKRTNKIPTSLTVAR